MAGGLAKHACDAIAGAQLLLNQVELLMLTTGTLCSHGAGQHCRQR